MPTRRSRLLAALAVLSFSPGLAAQSRPNVLFIAVDDLRPQLACYGESQMSTPNIDRLAAGGTRFDRSYCMVPTCGASRASLMSSIRPARHRFINHLAWAERDAKGITTLNTHFKSHGYYTVSLGKIFHHPEDNAQGWSEPPWRPERSTAYAIPENQAIADKAERGPPYESADVPDDAYADGRLAERAVADLRRLKDQDQPFFLAVGFFKPHLPFVAPKKYWDLYQREQIKLPDPYAPPKDAPAEAIHNWGELRNYAGVPKRGVLPEDAARTLIHGYYACVSYTDAQIGKVLDELERLDLAKNTIVILWGDHGWSLGEHTLWCKHCCFETAMRTPLIVRGPELPAGQAADGIVEFIDVYPTLCELADLPVPKHVQGRSFVPLLRDPKSPGKEFAIGRYQSGDTIRTDRYRLTEYTTPAGEHQADMLYDHGSDPEENVNLSGRSEQAQAVAELTQRLHEKMGRDAPGAGRSKPRDPRAKK